MSKDSTPPPNEMLQSWMTDAENVIKLIAENLRYGTWFKRLLLIDAVILFGLNPKVAEQIASIFFGMKELPSSYVQYYWVVVGAIFALALAVGIVTTPRSKALTPEDTKERKAIKGLRPFTAADADIFTRLQRKRDVQECLEAVTNDHYRFGILMGESGCGKTSFLQAGVIPQLTPKESTHQGIYVRFSDRNPFDIVLAEVAIFIQSQGSYQLSLGGTGADLASILLQASEISGKPLVLFFDQFEQFFVHQKRKEDREPFIHALKQWYDSTIPVKILISIRGDMSDRLVELQHRLGYSLGPQEVFSLERFSPEEATAILCVIAETEQLQFDQRFVKELTETELASREDGTISPVDLQILSWMIERQDTTEERAFNRVAFQKLGGVEGLLSRFLERTLDAQVIKSQREAALKVLLALTDLEKNVRTGSLTLPELQQKLQQSLIPSEVTEAITWLTRGDVRLVTPLEQQESIISYELAHERLIPGLLKLAGKELSNVDQANHLLERRVNEWLGSQRSQRYLLTWKELRIIEKQKPHLTWGKTQSQKKKFLQVSKLRIF